MAEIIEMSVKERMERTKGELKKIRKQGFIPAVVYGPEITPLKLWVPFSEIKEKLKSKKGEMVLLKFRSADSKSLDGKTVILKAQQIDPINFDILHIDFYEFKRGQKMDIEVPLHITGTPAGLRKGGILEISKRNLWVRCLPRDIPDYVEIDVSGLDIGDSIHIEEISLPEGIEVIEDKKVPVATVVAPAKEEEEEKVIEEIEEPEVISKGKVEEEEKETEEKKEE